MRTVVTVWDSADKESKRQIKQQITAEGRVSELSVHKWMRGDRKPLYLYQVLIQKTFKKVLSVNIPLAELFPN